MPKRSRHVDGLLPWLGGRIIALGAWLVRHPQPLIALGLVVAVAWLLVASAQRADAFRITQVYLPDEPALTLREPILGQNLWTLDLDALSEQLERQQPSLKQVRVVRQLPNAIRVEAVRRVPIAQVRLDRWYPVDGEGFILPPGSSAAAEGLMRLAGFERAAIPLTAGRVNRDERLALALRVLAWLPQAPGRIARRVTEMNVDNPQQIRFVLDGALEVRCGAEAELTTQWERLKTALKTVERQGWVVQYLDVRFQEPVVGPERS